MPTFGRGRIMPSLYHATEMIMTLGNILYLALAVGVFCLFSITLAYQSWRQSRAETKPARAQGQRVQSGVTVR